MTYLLQTDPMADKSVDELSDETLRKLVRHHHVYGAACVFGYIADFSVATFCEASRRKVQQAKLSRQQCGHRWVGLLS